MLPQRMYFGTIGFTLLAVPFFILAGDLMNTGGITTGYFTVTEASVIAALYAASPGFAYRDLKPSDPPDILFTSLKRTRGLMFIIAAADFFGRFTIFERIPDAPIMQPTALGASSAGFLWIVIAIIPVLGRFLDGNAIFLVTLPIFMKICPLFSIDMVNFDVVKILSITQCAGAPRLSGARGTLLTGLHRDLLQGFSRPDDGDDRTDHRLRDVEGVAVPLHADRRRHHAAVFGEKPVPGVPRRVRLAVRDVIPIIRPDGTGIPSRRVG